MKVKYINCIERDEKERLLNLFLSNRRSRDLAYFFLSDDDITIDDIFIYGSSIEKSFYNDVFKHLFFFMIDIIDKNRYDTDGFRKTIERFRIDYYIKSDTIISGYDANKHIKDIIQSSFIDTTVKYLSELNLVDSLNLFLDNINTNPHIPSDFIIDSIFRDKRFELSYKNILYMFNSDMLDVKNIIYDYDILVDRYDTYVLHEILFNVCNDSETKLKFIKIFFNIFYLDYDEKTDTHYLDIIDMKILSSKEKIDAVRELFKKFKEHFLLLNVEEDFYYNYIEEGLNHFGRSGSLYLLSCYKKLQKWYTENMDNGTFKENFINNKYVDNEVLTEDEALSMASDIVSQCYVQDYESMDNYDRFIRLINIARFSFLKIRKSSGINRMIDQSISNGFDRDLAFYATNPEYIFMLLYL